MKHYKVGIIGCGDISTNYARYAKSAFSDYFTIVACGDLNPEKARSLAEKYDIPRHGAPEVVYDDPEIDIVINLTVPSAHEEVIVRALEAGKHVYTEKPLATSREGCRHITEVARACGKRVGCAPDSFLSAPVQSAKKALEEDWIGKPIGINALCPLRGNELWRPDADFFYKKGAGPTLDMAAYYLNVFISLVGPVESVASMAKTTWEERTIKVAPRRGEKIGVEVPTYVSTNIQFESGVLGTFVNTFDVWASKTPNIEIFGEKGTLVLPDPNHYQGEVLFKRFNDKEWRPVPQFIEYSDYGRGIGVVDMIRSIEAGKNHRASVELGYHVTDVMLAINESAEDRTEHKIASTVEKPTGLWNDPETILWK